MKIKSLLLGSAAALVAVSGAQAADVVIVEPEPVEYVRICDVYGAGFFYIPGTETCLKINGFIRVDWKSNHYHDGWNTTVPTKRHTVSYKGQVGFYANNETEWGTLRSVLVINGSETDTESDAFSVADGPGNAGMVIDQALISLAGFRLGFSDDYWSSHGAYGFYSAISSGSGIYGYGQATFFDYTYAADGFRATVGMANGRSGNAGQPDAYVGADYSGSWGRLWGLYYYDSNMAAGAWKAGAELSLSDFIPGGRIKGWVSSDDGDTDYVKGHTWGITGKMDLTDNMHLYAGYADYSWTDYAVAPTGVDTSFTRMSVGVSWNMAPGLNTKFEYTKKNYDYQIIDTRASTGTFQIRVQRTW